MQHCIAAHDSLQALCTVTLCALHVSVQAMFLRVACMCRCLVACRVSPAQKRLLVRLVKKGVKPKPVTLAIGDGANDVGMILEAQVSACYHH
jgi:phospholipid-transporting ATPase